MITASIMASASASLWEDSASIGPEVAAMTAEDLLKHAQAYMRGGEEWLPDKLVGVAAKLTRYGEFALARRLFDEYEAWRTLQDPVNPPAHRDQVAVDQYRAYATYRDEGLPGGERLDRALAILCERCGLEGTPPPRASVSVVGGVIHLARWKVHGRVSDLFAARAVFERALQAEQGKPDPDVLAIVLAARAGFVEDLLASSVPDHTAGARAPYFARATGFRELAVRLVPEDGQLTGDPESVYLATWAVGEALLGLECFERNDEQGSAFDWIERARKLGADDEWLVQTMLPDLVRILRLRNGAHWEQRLADALGVPLHVVTDAQLGKLGLALSGGGLRASLYHLGVLAALAERDLLRRVEVLSCVSGGSIVGAYYYLWLKRLLAHKADSELTREHYITLVQVVSEHFVRAAQTNMRMHMLGDGLLNLARVVSGEFDTGGRFAETIEKHLYAPVEALWQREARRFGVTSFADTPTEFWMGDLLIKPAQQPNFQLERDNPARLNKVPVLVINATCMNTGHDWQFTASYMGEPPRPTPETLDSLPRLRRFYYVDSTGKRDPMNVRMSHAVAASACIPGVFPPMKMENWYHDLRLALADGGVHDNQGIAGLMEHDCQALIVSDASGPSSAREEADDGVLGGALRANAILQQRIREAQFEDLDSKRQAGLIRGFVLVHLTQGLECDPIDWKDCEDPFFRVGGAAKQLREQRTRMTPAGLRPDVLRPLSELRTDMDAHSDVEAHGLMGAAYHCAVSELERVATPLQLAERRQHAAWQFSVMDRFLLDWGDAPPPELERVIAHLKRGRSRFFRWFPASLNKRVAGRSPDIGHTIWGLIAVGIGWIPAEISLRFITPRLLRSGKVPLLPAEKT